MDAKARRMEINLQTLGTGVIAISIWSLIKFAMSFFVYLSDILKDIPQEYSFVIAILWGGIILDSLLYIYVGISARSESKGKRKTILYIVLTIILTVIIGITVLGEIASLFYAENGFASIIITIFIDVTSAVIMIDLAVNALGIRKMRKQSQEVRHES